MSGIEILVDTNIILYLLDGNKAVAEALQGRDIAVSVITELEVKGYHRLQKDQEQAVSAMFSEIVVIDLNTSVKQHTVAIRRKSKVKLPDAIIATTAMSLGVPLLTADADFKKIKSLELLLLE